MFEPCPLKSDRACGFCATFKGKLYCGVAKGGEDKNGNPRNCISDWKEGTECPMINGKNKAGKKKYIHPYYTTFLRQSKNEDKLLKLQAKKKQEQDNKGGNV